MHDERTHEDLVRAIEEMSKIVTALRNENAMLRRAPALVPGSVYGHVPNANVLDSVYGGVDPSEVL